MGIPGLTTYVNNRSDRYLQYYELRDTYLVIDGNSIGCQIYNWYAKCNCAFGGDYDRYAQSVSDFFDDLLKCNVTPLVLIDGGCEDKKLKTVIVRTKEKLRTALAYYPLKQQNTKFFPLLLKDVFKDVVKAKNIRCVQCLFEADNAIAAVARILNCPVLSYDSDFYIYGTLYIPFNTLDNYVVKSSTGNGYMKRCKVYRVENLLYSFKGLNQSMLPLAAILLGNDYVKRSTFRNFFRHMKLRGAARKKHNFQQCRIQTTLAWLSRYTLDKAIIGILSRIRKEKRQRILNIIETNINGYTNASAEILVPLGFSEEYAAQVKTHSVNRIFKFDGDINNLTYIEETCEEEDSEGNEDEEEEEEDDNVEIISATEKLDSVPNDTFVANLPLWFIHDFNKGMFPSYFMDLLVRNLYVCPVQIEDSDCPSSIIASLKIINVIYGLLMSGRNDKKCPMCYMIRGQKRSIVRCRLEPLDSLFSCKLPSLSNLRDIPLTIRKGILNNTLGITDQECINQLPSEWMLYIATIKYWIDQNQQKSFKSHCYIYSLLVCMLFDTIDCKIGQHRVMYYFQNKFGQKVLTVQQKRKMINLKPCYPTDVPIAKVHEEVDPDDCLLAACFFIQHFETSRKLHSNPKKFKRSIVHSFSEFQSCLRHSMNLNALLGYPYVQIRIAYLYNGTLLYNLYNNFTMRNDIEVYINNVLKDSPSLLRLFNVLLLKVKPLFTTLLQSRIHVCKKQKTKYRCTETDEEIVENDTDEPDGSECTQESFYDANNSYTLLSLQ